MIHLDRLSVYLPIPDITWNDLTAKVRLLFSRLPSWGIRAGSVSDEWLRRHERDAPKQ